MTTANKAIKSPLRREMDVLRLRQYLRGKTREEVAQIMERCLCDMEARIKLAKDINETNAHAAGMLQLSERTIFRFK